VTGADPLDLGYRVLDQELVDVNGRRCGRVDDVELAGDPLRATALLVGPGVYPGRLPARLGKLARRLVGPEVIGRNVVRVPWDEIDEIDVAVRLRRPARELGLGRGDDDLAPAVGKLMFSDEPEE
jgi:sporulation protein YlmC with PRC-barrel domain